MVTAAISWEVRHQDDYHHYGNHHCEANNGTLSVSAISLHSHYSVILYIHSGLKLSRNGDSCVREPYSTSNSLRGLPSMLCCGQASYRLVSGP